MGGLNPAGRTRYSLAALLLLAGTPGLEAQALWELQGTGSRIVLLGSIHFLRAADYPLAPAVQAAYEQADELLMELDPGAVDAQAAGALLLSLATDPEGRRLPGMLTPDEWRRTVALTRDLGIDSALLEPWEPWYAALLVTQLTLQRLGFSPELGLENWLLRQAQRDRKPVRGLETLAGQLALLDELPPAVQRRFLLRTLQEAADAQAQIDRIVAGWRAGDTALLADELLAGISAEPLLYQRLIVERNRHFADVIAALADTGGSYLVVVGALHLVGEHGIPALLGRQGLAVAFLPPD